MENIYDLVIIGGGPAGLSAGLYGARGKLKTLILEKEKNGGQIVITHQVDNYPGSLENATGPSLTARMVQQAKAFGCEIQRGEVVSFDFQSDIKTIRTKDAEYRTKSVIIASGANPRKMSCPGEDKLIGKGVSYCATCDADFFEDFEVFVIGGGDSAIEEAQYLTKFARKVTIVHRRQGFRCAPIALDKAKENPKIEFLLDTVVEEVKGDGILESIVFKNKITGEVTEYFADEEDGTFGCFVFIGYVPETEIYRGVLDCDEVGYFVAGDSTETKIPGVFVAGDCRQKPVRQVVTATSDGAVAAVMAERYIASKFD
ncbi:thioredoxin-disulfide reductase [Peptostreptococcus equinus]|uniref:Thioredoxin reductase n=1 Tax=Peptostreptococcus equinus TaxID=3003601 RepID=A0ABY7JPW5_9FIRM|nr:thioredoxin-disulfide reductase [Peptostreptococcus sp. CBA3647]WAW14534.1 thioredoxin-disulfide reductase [Peptostreptococcus sp. CBA3647]